MNDIKTRLDAARQMYYRLVLLVGSARSGKTSFLKAIAASQSAPLINVGLELSNRMLEVAEAQRPIETPKLLDEILRDTKDLVLLDNIEILFDVTLKQDALRLLQKVSRNRTVVAAWCGSIEKTFITYATPDHPEFRKHPIKDFLVVDPQAAQSGDSAR
jgi:adenosyl cobinamide kinase/adenosyl cobinamide phosphate guanylyltransferase